MEKANLCFLLSLTIIIFMISTVSAENLTVCDSGCDHTTIQSAIDAANEGDTIEVSAGEYIEEGQIVIDKNLTITGEGKTKTILMPDYTSTGIYTEGAGWFYIKSGILAIIKNLTLDGENQTINAAIQSRGNVVVENCLIKNIYEKQYYGFGIQLLDGTKNEIKNCEFSNIERVGIHVQGGKNEVTEVIANITDCIYTGRGEGDYLEYGIEFGGGGSGFVDNFTVSNVLGKESGWDSSGILATDLYGEGTSVNIENSTFSNNLVGIIVGYNELDTTTVIASKNAFIENSQYGIRAEDAVNTTATHNFWGSEDPDFEELVSDNVFYEPWCLDEECNELYERPPVYTKINTSLPYTYNETNNYWFNITLEDDSGVENASLLLKYPDNEEFTEIFLNNEGDLWYYNETGLDSGNYEYRFWANDTIGNEDNITSISRFTIGSLDEEDEVFEEEDNYEVPENKSNVVVEDSSKIKNISISENNTQSVSLTFNNRPDNKITFANNITIKRTTTDNKSLEVTIPENTKMTVNDSNWDGKFTLPEPKKIILDNKKIDLAIKVGADVEINFDKPVKLILPGQGDAKKIAWTRDDINLNEITRQCDSASNPTNIASNGTYKSCWIKSSDQKDIIIWTYHFTTFLTYDDVTPTSSSPSSSTRTITKYVEKDTEEENTPENEIIDENTTVQQDEETTPTTGPITGLVVGEGQGSKTFRTITISILSIILILALYYMNFTISGLSKRAERLHKKADKLNQDGKYQNSLKYRTRARNIQRRADKRRY